MTNGDNLDEKKPKSSKDIAPKKNAKVKAKEEIKKEAIKEEAENKSVSKIKKEAEDSTYEWWNSDNASTSDIQGDDSIKWTTLHHKGVFFAPEYEAINIPLNYKGCNEDIYLPKEAEEVAGFFAAMIETDHAKNKKFRKNFWSDFVKILKKCAKKSENVEYAKNALKILKNLDDVDFGKMTKYFEAEREKRKSMTKEQKEEIKKEKQEIEDHYGWAILDGRKEKLGNFRVEPPGLFRGRGDHPKTGHLKKRVYPEQVTLNLSKDAPVPEAPKGHKWGDIIHDNTVAWIATWKENVNDNTKYVLFSATSSLKGQSDMKKFEKARELNKCVKSIRDTYLKELNSKDLKTKQRATAMYLIDRLALRAGNEKGEDEADTVGCCSLRCEHIETKPPNILVFDFLGKDSIRYHNEVEVIDEVYKNISTLKKGKKKGDMIFSHLNTATLNKHLNTLMPGLTAKVFRTYNASHTFQEQLKNTPKEGTLSDKILAYNRANREVAVLCNHQKAVSKNFETQISKLEDKILALKYQRQRIKKILLSISDAKFFKSNPNLKTECQEFEEELTDEWCLKYLKEVTDKDKIKLLKKLEDKKINKDEYKKKISSIEENEKLLASEIKSGKIKTKELPSAFKSSEKLYEKLNLLNKKIEIALNNRLDKDENKTTSLGTSKTNYIDPRITVSWSKKFDVPLEKLFNKALLEKFKWAQNVDQNWEF